MPAHVTLGPDGRLEAGDAATAERLRAAGGRYQLTPSGPDLLVLVRDPARGGSVKAPRVAMAGDLACTPLADLVELLHQGRRTGSLRVITPSGERAMVLEGGMIRGAHSDDVADSLGEVCVRLGLVQRAQLEQVLASSPPPGRVGRMLVEMGALQSHDLFKATQHQVTEIFHTMLLAGEGAFLLMDEPIEDHVGGVQLNTQALLMDAIRRIDEMAQFRSRLPTGRLHIVRRKPASPALEPEEQRLYELSSGERTVLDLAREMRLSEFEATKFIYHLLEGGYVSTSATPQVSPGEAKRNDPADVARVFNLIFREILSEVAKHGVASEFVASANGALRSEAATRSPFLRGMAFAADGSLDQDRLMVEVERDGIDEGLPRALFQALSEVMFFLLFQAGEVLAVQEDELLARRVKELLATIDPG